MLTICERINRMKVRARVKVRLSSLISQAFPLRAHFLQASRKKRNIAFGNYLTPTGLETCDLLETHCHSMIIKIIQLRVKIIELSKIGKNKNNRLRVTVS